MINREEGKEEHTLISLLPQEDLGWPDERRHAPADAGWRRLTSPDTLDAAATEHHHLHLLYSSAVQSPKSHAQPARGV
jgi:hypothetical protein